MALIDGRNLLTHSRMACAKTCLRRHYYAYESGIHRERATIPLRVGGWIHKGLEWLGDGVPMEAVCQRITDAYADVPDYIEDWPEWFTEAEVVKRLLVGYVWRWGADGNEILANELAFDLPLRNPDTDAPSTVWRLAGKIDRIVKMPDGRVAIQEFKTASEDIASESDYWKRLRMDQQISLYVHAARRLDYPVETIIYDVIRKPTIRPRKLTKAERYVLQERGEYFGQKFLRDTVIPETETPELYGARLNADIGKRPDYYYARMEIPRLDSDMQEFEAELWQIQQTLRSCQRESRWYRNTAACLHPYRCEYFDICCAGDYPIKETPVGFVKLDFVHPELEEGYRDDRINQTAGADGSAQETADDATTVVVSTHVDASSSAAV